jgi:hypothetical protein
MLQHHDLLMTIAQVASTFAGFSGIIGVFRRGVSLSESDMGALQVRDVVEISVSVTGFALLPFIPDGFGIAEDISWRLSSGVAAVVLICGFTAAMRRVRTSAGAIFAPDPLLLRVALTVLGTVQIALWMNVLGVASDVSATLYVSALLLTLGHAGFMFVRLLTPRK